MLLWLLEDIIRFSLFPVDEIIFVFISDAFFTHQVFYIIYRTTLLWSALFKLFFNWWYFILLTSAFNIFTFKRIFNLFWSMVSEYFIISFWFKKAHKYLFGMTFRILIDSETQLINHLWHWYQVFSVIGLVFVISVF